MNNPNEPSDPSDLCGLCNETVSQNQHAICCDTCYDWIHIKCNKLATADYRFYQFNEKEKFTCMSCLADTIPFSTLNNYQFDTLINKGKNTIPKSQNESEESSKCGVCNRTVAINHRAIECNICFEWIHIKCNKFNQKDYEFYQNNTNEKFFCLKYIDGNIPFSSINNNQFEIVNKKGVNYLSDNDIRFNPTETQKKYCNQIQNIINQHAFELNDDDSEFDDECSIDCRYYTIDEFESKKFNTDKYFSILHLNIHSVELHIEEFKIILKMLNFKFDFICLSETKIQDNSEPKVDINIPGYQKPIGTTTIANKGGVLIYAKNGINYFPRNDLTNSLYSPKELESFFIEVIDEKNKNSIIGIIYRHPCMNEVSFNDDFLKPFTEKVSSEEKQCFIAGDFNFDLLSTTQHNETSNFFDIMMSNFLLPTIKIPTKINVVKSTIIDNIFTNYFHPDMKTGNLTIGLSDHLPSFMIVPKHNQNHIPKKQNLFRRDTKNFDRQNFILDYLAIDWNETLDLQKNDTNHSLNKFMTKINSLVDHYMPLKKVSNKEYKRRLKPWITNSILNKIKYKNKIFKKYSNCKNNNNRKQELLNEYKVIKNEITTQTRIGKKQFYQRYFTENKTNLKKIWKGIKEIINIKSKNFDQPTCLKTDDETITDPKQIANKFNSYFTSIADNILKERKYEGNPNDQFTDFLMTPLDTSFLFTECNENEIKALISSLNPNKASGPNSIPTFVLHLLKDDICSPICKILNLSLSTGQHPDIFKIAKATAVFKKGSRLLVSNYRPISLLSNINKILEKLVFSRMFKFLDEHNCIYSHQFGFRPKHSTNHALVNITENIRKSLDENKFACGIFVDLQ